MLRKLLPGCPIGCRSIVKLFVVRKRMFRRSPDDKPHLLCLGSKPGGNVVIKPHGTCLEAAREKQAILDWLDTPQGQAAYSDTITYFRNRILHRAGKGEP